MVVNISVTMGVMFVNKCVNMFSVNICVNMCENICVKQKDF